MTREQSKLSPKKIGPKPRKASQSTQEQRQQKKMAQPAKQANNLAKMGRYGDSELVHMHPAEIQGLASLMGRQPTINPKTGKPEMFFFLPFLAAPAMAAAAAPALAAATAAPALAATALPAAATAGGMAGALGAGATGAALAGGTGLASLGAAAPAATAGLSGATGAAAAAAPAAATAAGEAAAMGAGASGALSGATGAAGSLTAAAPEALGGAMASAPEALGAAGAAPSSLASGTAALPQSSQFLSGGLEIGSSNAASAASAPMSAANNIGATFPGGSVPTTEGLGSASSAFQPGATSMPGNNVLGWQSTPMSEGQISSAVAKNPGFFQGTNLEAMAKPYMPGSQFPSGAVPEFPATSNVPTMQGVELAPKTIDQVPLGVSDRMAGAFGQFPNATTTPNTGIAGLSSPPGSVAQGAPLQAPTPDLAAATQPPPVNAPSDMGMPMPKPGGPMSSNPMLPPTSQDFAASGMRPLGMTGPNDYFSPSFDMFSNATPMDVPNSLSGMADTSRLGDAFQMFPQNSPASSINTQGIAQLTPQARIDQAFAPFESLGIEGQGLPGLQVQMPPQTPPAPPVSAEVMPNAGSFSGTNPAVQSVNVTPTSTPQTVPNATARIDQAFSQFPQNNLPQPPSAKPMPEPPAPKPTPSAAAETAAPKSTPTPNTSSAPAAETAPRTTGAAGLNAPSGSAPTSGTTTTTQTAAKEAIANKGIGKIPVPQSKPAVPTPKYPMPQPKPEFASEIPMGGGDMPAPTPKPGAIGESTVAGVGQTPTPAASTAPAASNSGGTGLFGGMFSGNTMQYMLPAMMMMSQMGTQYPSAGGGDGEKNRFKNWNKDYYRQKERMDWNFDPLSTSKEHKYFRNTKGGSGRKAEGGMVTKGPGFGSGLGSITQGSSPGGGGGSMLGNMPPMGGMPMGGGGMGGAPMGAPPNVQGPMSPGFLGGGAQGMAGGGMTPTNPNNPTAGQPYFMKQMIDAFDTGGVEDFSNWTPENPNKFLNSWGKEYGPQYAPNAATAGRRAGGGMLSEATGGGLPAGVTLGGPDPVGSIQGPNPNGFSGIPLMDPMKAGDPAYQYKYFMNDLMPALEGSTIDESGLKDGSDSMLKKGGSLIEQPKNPGSGPAKKMNHGGLASLRYSSGGMSPASRGEPAPGGGGGNGGWWNNREIPQWLGPIPFASIVEQYEGTPLKDIKANGMAGGGEVGGGGGGQRNQNYPQWLGPWYVGDLYDEWAGRGGGAKGMAAGGLMGAEPPPSNAGMSNRPMSPTSGGMMGGQAGGATNNPMAMGRGGMGGGARPEPAMGMGTRPMGMARPPMNRPGGFGGGAMGEGGFGMWGGTMGMAEGPDGGNPNMWLGSNGSFGMAPNVNRPYSRPVMGMGRPTGNFNQPTGANRMASGGMMMSPEKKMMKDAELALQGQHPNPQAALQQYIQVYGENSLMDLANKIAGQQPINASRQSPSEPHFLQGPGDGMSDSIPAGNQSQDVILSDGEYVVPADVVSGLGNGSSNAGARRLDQMVGKIRQDRTGNTSQPKAIDPRRYIG